MPILRRNERVQARSGVYYRNLQWLGSGGNAEVYLTLALNDQFRGVLFALKIFLRTSDEVRSERFLQETEFLKTCDHPSIMRVYDDGTYEHRQGNLAEEYPFVVAEYLPKTLHNIMQEGSSSVERVSYTLQLLSGLAYLDQLDPKVVHRDIKPKNIFVKGKSCVLGDFGLMKFVENEVEGEEETEDVEIYKESIGPRMPFFYRTPDLVAYAKNEAALSTISDVYQLGLVVAHLFTGWNPQKRAENFLDPIELENIGFIPGALHSTVRDLIGAMLEQDPGERMSPADLIDGWDGVFRETVDLSNRLDGRVF